MTDKIKSILIYILIYVSISLTIKAQDTIYNSPKKVYPIPTKAQLEWQKLETYAFIHIGLNTFNDLEWGYGNTNPQIFNPKHLDCDRWVKILKAAGMKGIILTAKHHDGFCLWPTKTTEYSVKNSPWRNGKGDLVKELSDACHKYGLLFGVYLSPWDRNSSYYGTKKYIEIFHNQIKELSTQYGKLFEYWFDGANGGNGWYGGADTIRRISPKTYYRYADAVKILKKNNPDIMIFGGTEPTIRWVGNEHGTAGMTNWSPFSLKLNEKRGVNGYENGEKWLPAECDVSIRPGWFYHKREDHQVKTLGSLIDLYYRSVGRNGSLLLNCPINKNGEFPKLDSTRLMQLKEYLDNTFAHNLFKNAKAEASNTRKGNYSVYNLIRNNSKYWATEDSIDSACVILSLPKKIKTNVIELQEYIPLGQRIDRFTIYYKNTSNNDWNKVKTIDSLTTIGYKRLIRIDPVETNQFKFNFHSRKGSICIAKIGAYISEDIPENAVVNRDKNNIVTISSTNKNSNIYYRIPSKGQKYQLYKSPFNLPDNNVIIETKVTTPTSKKIAISKRQLGYSMLNTQIKGLPIKYANNIFNTNGYISSTMPKGNNSIIVKFNEPILIKKIKYIPNQHRDAKGHIIDYEVYGDGKFIQKGSFDNIKNNPIANTIILKNPNKYSEIELKATRLSDDNSRLSIGAIEFFK